MQNINLAADGKNPNQKNQLYAHSLPEKPQSEWQTLTDHSNEVARMASEFAALFQSKDWAWNAGQLHDIGKADPRFQAYLLRSNGMDDSEYDVSGQGKINHSSAGAALALEQFGPLAGHALAYIIAGHHAGLPDWFPTDTGNAALQIRLEEGETNLKEIHQAAESIKPLIREMKPPSFLNPQTFHIWVRMVFSCLVDADFLDTESFMQPDQAQVRGAYMSLASLKLKFDEHMNRFADEAEQSPVNKIRSKILTDCREAALDKPGLFSLTVPTGGGKTLSAMAFALDHAKQYNKSRIIYVIPYTSIIEQTASILSEIFGQDQVIEHHSNLNPEKETQRTRLAAENWDAPIIVTTNVQFFESLFAAKTSRCRKLHNIVNSVVILDEAQMLPTELLSPCVAMLNTLAKDYSATILFATATQPALSALPKQWASLNPTTEIVTDVKSLYSDLKRVNYHFPNDLNTPGSWDEIAQELVNSDSVLCVVNTRRDCYDLFQLMPEGTIHLSALMCGEHRSRIIAEIKRALKNKEPIRVISTQLVEAGVDIDFPVVYRAMTGLDSVAQAAGRCNREGKLGAGDVYVFIPPKPAPKGLLRKGEDTTREMLHSPLDLNSPECFHNYFSQFYQKANDLGSKFHDWLEKAPEIHFRTAGKEFNLINDAAQRPVIVRYGDSEKWIRQLQFAGPTRQIMRRLQRYTVNLPTRMIDIMLADGRLALANSDKAPDIVLQGVIDYDSVIGLDIYNEQLPIEDLIT